MTTQEAIEILTEMRDWNDYITQSDALQMAIDELEKKPAANSEDAISRQAVMDGLGKYHEGADLHIDGLTYAYDLVCKLPSVSTEANKEDIHREREQAYMKGYEDASKRYRTEPCEDAISRSDAIRVASGYCHWSNIPKELAKLPSVNPIPCEDAISKQAAIRLAEQGQVQGRKER